MCDSPALRYVIVEIVCAVNSDMLSTNNASDMHQQTGIRTAKVGETVTLSCSCKHDSANYLLWFQQSPGGKPHIVSKWMRHHTEVEIPLAYKKRFQVVANSANGVNDLMISNLQPSDSGTYYCAFLRYADLVFGQGVFLHVKTSPSKNTTLPFRQPKLKLLHLGESVNLSCRIYAEPCAAEPDLYWFRDAGLKPGLLYPSDSHCTSGFNGTFRGKYCTSNLMLDLMRSSDAGTYHCALASCGVVVFGGGTKVEIIGMWPSQIPLLLVYCLSAALALSIIGVLVLTSFMYKLSLKLKSVCEGSLHYAAVNLRRSTEQRLGGDTEEACVYSRVKRPKE
uniref:Ig-like domain-containing protein n=1 Tax=Poecilia latipinna TaxID=48699 RepID=A0A3B3TIB5_9TELE